jgi:hypothetical protein
VSSVFATAIKQEISCKVSFENKEPARKKSMTRLQKTEPSNKVVMHQIKKNAK